MLLPVKMLQAGISSESEEMCIHTADCRKLGRVGGSFIMDKKNSTELWNSKEVMTTKCTRNKCFVDPEDLQEFFIHILETDRIEHIKMSGTLLDIFLDFSQKQLNAGINGIQSCN